MAHIQKAWPVVCARNGGIVDLHSHRNAQLSAVFYVLRIWPTRARSWNLRRQTITSAM